MHIIVTCPQCSRQLRLPREVLGSTVRCSLCQAVFMTRETADVPGGTIVRDAQGEPTQPLGCHERRFVPDIIADLDQGLADR